MPYCLVEAMSRFDQAKPWSSKSTVSHFVVRRVQGPDDELMSNARPLAKEEPDAAPTGEARPARWRPEDASGAARGGRREASLPVEAMFRLDQTKAWSSQSTTRHFIVRSVQGRDDELMTKRVTGTRQLVDRAASCTNS